MTITAYDTNTGTELSVRDITREIARQDEAEYLPCPWGEQIEADLGRTFAAWSGQLDSFAADIRAVLARRDVAVGQMEAEAAALREHQSWARNVLSPPFADLPPDPALQLAPDRLDAEFDREQALNQLVRRKQAEDKWAQQGRVPEVPPKPQPSRWARVKRAVVAVLQRDAEERAL